MRSSGIRICTDALSKTKAFFSKTIQSGRIEISENIKFFQFALVGLKADAVESEIIN